MTTEMEPRTAAGRRLLQHGVQVVQPGGDDWHVTPPLAVIAAIEDESWNAALAAVEEVIHAEQQRRMDPASGQISTRRTLSAIASLRKPVTP